MTNESLPIAVRRLHHVGWIVPDQSAADATRETLNLDVLFQYYVEEFQSECIFLSPASSPSGCLSQVSGLLELVIPSGGVLAQFNKGHGGLHHVAYEVDDLNLATEILIHAGLPPIEPSAVRAGPFLVSFLSPAVTRGLTIELLECPSANSDFDPRSEL